MCIFDKHKAKVDAQEKRIAAPKTDSVSGIPFPSYKGKAPYVFISYAHKDSAKVYPIISEFYKKKYNVWYDEGIEPGIDWPEEIANALTYCALFVVFITPAAMASRNVRNEISFALAHENLPFIAIHLQETELTHGLQLLMGSKQAILKYKMDDDSFNRKYTYSFRTIFRNSKRKVLPPKEPDLSTPPPMEKPDIPDNNVSLQDHDISISGKARTIKYISEKTKTIMLVTLTIGVLVILITQLWKFPDQGVNGKIASNVLDMTQTPQTIATEAPAYVKGLTKGSVIDKVIRETLSIPSGDLLLKDVERIEEIDLSWLSLTDIEELSELTGLKKLDLHNNRISDLSPISGLIGLESMLIYNNHITSLQPLSGLTNLTELSAENNQISNVSPLAGLTTLKKLFLQNNQIVDVSPIRNLTNLTHLALDNNPISDFTPLRIFDTTVFQIPQK